jgi:hypothetical protein
LGSYAGDCSVLNAQGIPTVDINQDETTIDGLMLNVVNSAGAKPVMRIDLANEIAPSNYDVQCSITGRKNFISAVWSYYASRYDYAKASFSSILDSSTTFEIAGNRLKNLISTIEATGKSVPKWFEVHTYGSTADVVNMLRGNYQVYADFGFLSNQANPKETIIGESFYEDVNSAKGVQSYLGTYDGYNGGKITLSTVLTWPIGNPLSGCTNDPQFRPPYKATVYNNVMNYGLQTLPTIVASPNPAPTGSTTITWTPTGYSWISIPYLLDGVYQGGFSGGVGNGSSGASIATGHTYTFQLYPALPPNGSPDYSHLLDSVTVATQ